MFFVVAEIHNTGYFIGEFSTFEESNMAQSTIFNLLIKYSFHELQKSNSILKEYRKYKINNGDGIRCFKAQTTDGVVSVYSIEVNNTHPSIASFIKRREFQSKLFPYEELDKIVEDYE